MESQVWEDYPLLATTWKTKNSRFSASERLNRRHWWKTVSLGLIACYVLAFSVVPVFFVETLATDNVEYFRFVAFLSSLLIVVLSVVSGFDSDAVRAKYLHDNAVHISELYHEFKLFVISGASQDAIRKKERAIKQAYDNAITKCSFNHDGLDYLHTRVSVKRDSNEKVFWTHTQYLTRYFFNVYFWPLCAVLLPPILVGIPFIVGSGTPS